MIIIPLKEKSLDDKYFLKLEQPDVDVKISLMWLKKPNIHSETERFIFAFQHQAINLY
jgi:hypothetical protein